MEFLALGFEGEFGGVVTESMLEIESESESNELENEGRESVSVFDFFMGERLRDLFSAESVF
jgi:hypothetical protein